MNPRVGITLGDVTGVGPEVTAKALGTLTAQQPAVEFVVIGNAGEVETWSQRLGLNIRSSGRVRVIDPCGESSAGSPFTRDTSKEHTDARLTKSPSDNAAAARAAVEWIREGARRCLAGELDALVTAPVNKQAIVRAGIPFVGHTELLSKLAGEPRPVMMLLGPDDHDRWLRVALATVHLPIREVPSQLTRDKVAWAIERAAQACRDLALPRARVGVCGLNPHAGEGGAFGDEEERIIRPAIRTACDAGIDVVGPLSGDTAFYQASRGEYDAVVAMYHDQGLAPLKLAAFNTGVNWTLGLPFVRTSPDHGTAYDIAGRGVADPQSMISAIQLAIQLIAVKRGTE